MSDAVSDFYRDEERHAAADIRERIIREKAARAERMYDGETVRCPKCGHLQAASEKAVAGQVTWPGRHGDDSGYEEACGACGCCYPVDIEITVTLVSPPREGGERG